MKSHLPTEKDLGLPKGLSPKPKFLLAVLIKNRLTGVTAVCIIIIRTFVTRAVSANILNLRRRQSLGKEDGGSEV